MATWNVISSSNVISDGGGSSYLVASVTLTDAQIKALPTTYIEIVPAPGAGKYLSLIKAPMILDRSAGVYTNVSADNYVLIGLGDWDNEASNYGQLFNRDPGTPGIYFNDLIGNAYPGSGSYAGLLMSLTFPLSQYENKPMKIVMNNTGDLTGGNSANTLKVTVYYVVVDL